MKLAPLLRQSKEAEARLQRELDVLAGRDTIHARQEETRFSLSETLSEEPVQQEVRDRIEHLQLRVELLRNIRMQWKKFEKHASERGVELRINQFSALQHLISFLDTGKGQVSDTEISEAQDELDRALMAYEVQPTGAGKTGAFAIETALMGVPTLILVPFDNLVHQTKKDLIKIGGFREEDVGLVGGGTKEFGRFVTVATYQGHAAEMKKQGPYSNHIQTKVKFCICDEVHTSLGERTQESLESIDGLGNGALSNSESEALDEEENILTHLSESTPVKALKIGFTATPKLAAKHVQKFFPHFLGRVYHRDMVEAGILVPYRIVQCNGSVSEGEIGECISEELEIEILTREGIYDKLIGDYVDSLKTYGKMKKKNTYPMRGMAFCTNHAECEKFAKQAEAVGLRCQIVTGKEATGKQGIEVIEKAKERLCKGEIDLIVTVEKLCAGFNFPEINAVIWARVTSMAKTIQGIGRGGRSHREGSRIKECCWVFETNWTLKNNATRGKTPMKIADALAANGEDPEKICTMANGKKLEYQKPITPELIMQILTSKYIPETWSRLTLEERSGRNFAGTNVGIFTIASIFEVKSNPLSTVGLHELGRIIWPDTYGDPEEKEKERVRSMIQKVYSAETWSKLAGEKRDGADFAGTGMGLYKIGSLFGSGGEPSRINADLHALGKAIWPEIYVVPEAPTRERIREILISNYTPISWGKVPGKARKGTNFAGTGIGLRSIATLFDIAGNPVLDNSVMHSLGRAIWPDSYGDPEERERERVRLLITTTFTPETWSKLSIADRKGTNFAGSHMGITAIAGLFGIQGNTGSAPTRRELGRAIWKEEYGDPEEKERERIRSIIQSVHTPDTWTLLSREERKGQNFAGTGVGITTIASMFNVENPYGTFGFNELGHAIWPETYEDPEEKERKRVRGLILALYTPDIWMKLPREGRAGKNFANTGMGMQGIASLFGVEGNPSNKIEDHHNLGRALWGELYPDPKENERKRVKAILLASYSPEAWARLSREERRGENFANTGMGIIKIARLFNVESNPTKSFVEVHALGRAIFGEQSCFNQ